MVIVLQSIKKNPNSRNTSLCNFLTFLFNNNLSVKSFQCKHGTLLGGWWVHEFVLSTAIAKHNSKPNNQTIKR